MIFVPDCYSFNLSVFLFLTTFAKPFFLFFTETQDSEAADSNDVTCSRVPDLDSSEYSNFWLRRNCYTQTNYICAVYLSPNSTDYPIFFLFFIQEWSTYYASLMSLKSPFLEILVVTTAIGFLLISKIQLVNKSSTLLSSIA